MREYAFQLPTPLYVERQEQIAAELFDLAGGFSTTDVKGHWCDPATGRVYSAPRPLPGSRTCRIEPMTEIRVAEQQNKGDHILLFAMVTARAMGEKALYWRGADGSVEIVEL